jgi:hypothetical protein
MLKVEPDTRSHRALSGHARPPQIPLGSRQRGSRLRHPPVSLLVAPCEGAEAANTGMRQFGHVTCSRVRNESIPHGHTVVVRERRQLGHIKASSVTLRLSAHACARAQARARGTRRLCGRSAECQHHVSSMARAHLVLGLRVRRARRHTEKELVGIEGADHHTCHRRWHRLWGRALWSRLYV